LPNMDLQIISFMVLLTFSHGERKLSKHQKKITEKITEKMDGKTTEYIDHADWNITENKKWDRTDGNSTDNTIYEIGREMAGRFLGLFTIVRFSHTTCQSGSFTGACMSPASCTECGGIGNGTCASGFGVCCVVTTSTCGSTISINSTYISGVNAATGSCSYSISVPDNVCHVRLDFNKFELDGPTDNSQPNLAGRCTTDRFSIQRTGGRPDGLTLCGNNTGQHLYFDVSKGDIADLMFILDQTSSFSRQWEIQTQFIECGNGRNGCDQFHTGTSGTITSFNYFNTDATRQVHLAGLDYTVCVRREKGHCCIRLTPSTVPDGYDLNGAVCSSDCNTALTCRTDGTDHFLIPQANHDGKNPTTYTRFCGSLMNVFSVSTAQHPVVTCSVPFNFHFHSADSGNSGNTRGLNLRYVQLPCRRY